MINEVFKLEIDGKSYEYPAGTRYMQVAKDLQKDYEHAIVLVMANGRLRELSRSVRSDAKVSMVTTAESAGHKTYKRSMSMLLVKAIRDLDPEARAVAHFSTSNGLFFRLRNQSAPDAEWIARVKAHMEEIVKKDIPITKRNIPLAEARELFAKYGMEDKEELFRYRRSSSVNIYTMENFEDYNYGYMVPSTGYLAYFDLIPYEDGFVLITPEKEAPEQLEPYAPSKKIFDAQRVSEDWGMSLGVDTVGRLNRRIAETGLNQLMLIEEAHQERRISEIAAEIASRPEVKFVMVAGPSSSGKTTFSRRISIQLLAHGLTPHPISLDNYYKERTEIPRDESGDYDFECLEALDLALFQKQMEALLAGEEVELPHYDFKSGSKNYKGDFLKLGENDILVMEGIHGLNEKMSFFIPSERKFKIYISALTQLNVDEHNRIPTTDGRELRRIVRDNRTRGTSAQETIAMWTSVRRGEDRYIFPNQDAADVIFNSSLIYELAILKIYAEPLLFRIPEGAKEHAEAKRLLKFLDYFLSVPSEDVPGNSILREFIGGSCFDV